MISVILEILYFLCLLGCQVSFIKTSISTKSQRQFGLFSNNEKNLADISKPTVWTVFGELANKLPLSSNLGQGFPDWDPPEFVTNALQIASKTNFHQYTRPSGHVPLVELIGMRYSKHLQRYIDPLNEIVITVGASQALYLTLTTILTADDEIIIFEPFFDLYLKQIKLTGAKPVFVALGGSASTEADPWALDFEALDRAINPKTKVILLNSPHNPTGKVFTKKELEYIADIVSRHPNIIVVSDEVYKFTIYNPQEDGDETARGHYHFARFPNMWDRTITLSSCGKTFSVTGWQVGWMIGPKKYIKPVQDLIPCVQFCAATPIQHALTLALKEAENSYCGYDNYYEWLRSQFQTKRLILEQGLRANGIIPLNSHGGFFLMAKLPKLEYIEELSFISNEFYDWEYCRDLAIKKGVISIPASPFFSNVELIAKLGPMARFAFCKKDSTLEQASRKLQINENLNPIESTLIL